MMFPEYGCVPLFLCPADLGHRGVRRDRVFIFLGHTQRCAYLVDIYEAFDEIKRKIGKFVRTEPQDYMVSGPMVQQVQNHRMAQKRKRQFQPEFQLNYIVCTCTHCIFVYASSSLHYIWAHVTFKPTQTCSIVPKSSLNCARSYSIDQKHFSPHHASIYGSSM